MLRIGTAQKAIVQCFIGDTGLLQLTLGILMTIQTELGIVGKVGTVLEKEGAKVLVNRINVVLIHQRRRTHDPRIAHSCLWITPFLGPEYVDLLLRFANEQHPFCLCKLG